MLNSVEATLKLQALLLSHTFEVLVALTQYPTVAHALARADVHGCTHEVVNDHLAQSHQESQKLLSSQKLLATSMFDMFCNCYQKHVRAARATLLVVFKNIKSHRFISLKRYFHRIMHLLVLYKQ